MNWLTESDRAGGGLLVGMAAALAALLALMFWAAVVGPTDHQVRQAAQADYCQAVAQWNDMADRGIPAAKRFGHPDYDDRASDCTDYTSASGEQLASW